MISIEKLLRVKRLITHEHCADGITSAMIIRNVLPDVEVTFCQYNTQTHMNLEPEEGALFCDFSPYWPKEKPPAEMTDEDHRALEEASRRVQGFIDAGAIVLDHHETQAACIKRFGSLGVYSAEPGVCGAVLAYRHVWLPLVQEMTSLAGEPMRMEGLAAIRLAMADFATVAGIQDTWQRKDPRFREALEQAEAVKFWPVEMLLKDAVSSDPIGDIRGRLKLGPVLYDRKQTASQKCIDTGWRFTAPGDLRVIVFEGLRKTSDVAEMMHRDVDLVVGFGFTCEKDAEGNQLPAVIFSTRSHTGFDCAAMAKAHGGGGHRAAAGFNQRLVGSSANPYTMIQNIVTAWQTKQLEAAVTDPPPETGP